MTRPTLQEIARALRGKINGNQVLCAGPGHSHRDQSLSIRLSTQNADGFVIYSHAGDDFRQCRDYVADAIGLPSDRWRQDRPQPSPAEIEARGAAQERARRQEEADEKTRQRNALRIWERAEHPAGTLAEVYLASRALILTDDVAGEVLRFAPACPWDRGTVPAMVALFRDIATDEPRAIHRVALTRDGKKVGRKMLGLAGGCAIKLDADETVTMGLAIGEGIETGLAARQLGIRPVWALGSVDAIRGFPVLEGIEALSVLAETDDGGASERAAREVGTRWHRAGKSVEIIEPTVPGDLNDAIQGGATTWQ